MTESQNSSKALLARAYTLSNDKETKSLYRDWASTYDQTMLDGLGYLTPQNTAKLLSSVLEYKQAFILDVGSGTGLAGQNLAELGYDNIDAFDYSPEMLGIAKVRQHQGRQVYKNCIQADLNMPIDIQTNTYDAIICTGLFTHAHVGAGCLPELFRILKPNSFFATTVHKDIWSEGGFEVEVGNLEEAGILKTVSKEPGNYFETDKEPQGYYIIWECVK